MLDKIKDVFSKITKATVVDAKLVDDIVKDVQRALISSDMSITLVQQLSKDIKHAALDEKIPPGVSRKEHLTKIIYDRLVEILGGEQYKPRLEPHKILLVGLYGSGKTTTTGKLAKFYAKRGLKPCLITTDTWRPAAFEQVKQVGAGVNVPVYSEPGRDSIKVLTQALEKAQKNKHDLIIVDSAGRDSLNSELIDEIKKISKILKPEETFLVIASDIGQTASSQAKQFNESIGLTGIIATKADASGKAGGALSACHIAKVPVAFIGTGEKAEDFEVFNAKKFVGRILGLPDLDSLLMKMKEATEETEFNPEDILKGDYTITTFYKQLEATKKMGPLKKVFEMLGMGAMPQEAIETSEDKLKKYKFIMESMTTKEKDEPDLLNASRIKRIAKGSGCSEQDVKEMLKQFEMSSKMIKKLKKGKMRNVQQMMKRFQGGAGMTDVKFR